MKKTIVLGALLALTFSCKNENKKQDTGVVETEKPVWDTIYGGADKAYDTILLQMRSKVAPQFKVLSFKDAETGLTMEYNLFIPKDYDKSKKYPLVQFIADASTVGRGVEAPLMQGYGGIIWATEESQKENPSFVLVPSFKGPEWAVNDEWQISPEVGVAHRLLKDVIATYSIDQDRIYATGQSMGGMMSFYYNATYPNLFAASIFVSSQWNIKVLQPLVHDKFFYIVSGGDDKASNGMLQVGELLTKNNVKYGFTEFSAQLPLDEQDVITEKEIEEGHAINFVKFTKGSVLPQGATAQPGSEHMYSFDYAYRIKSVRDWLFKQKK